MRTTAIPRLITHFEALFSVKLTDESKTLRDVLAQIDARLFQSYTAPTDATLAEIIRNGISSPTWSAGPSNPTYKPRDVRPYIYDALLALVLVHAEISSTLPTSSAPQTASSSSSSSSSSAAAASQPSTLTTILTHHLLHASRALLAALRARPRFTLADLIQATLDVEFFAQTLQAYATPAASTAQSDAYLAMDERTDHDARTALQAQLPEMKAVLKRLKEGTRGEFACFRPSAAEKSERRERGRERGGTDSGGPR